MRTVLLIACAGLAGCVPARLSGYRPIGPGTLESGYCVAGIQDRLNMAAPAGVQLHIRAVPVESGQRVALDIDLVVPAGTTARLLSDELVVKTAGSPTAQQVRITRITAPGPVTLEPLATLAGSSEESRGHYSIWLTPQGQGSYRKSPLAAAPRFSVELPAMAVDGEVFQPGPVAFEAYREWGMYYCIQ